MAANSHTRHYFNVIQYAIVFGVFNSYHAVIIRFIINDARKLLRLIFFFELLQHSRVGT